MSIEREIYKRIGKNDWELVKLESVTVGDIISIHDNGKFQGLFRTISPAYVDKDGKWTVQLNRYKEGE